MDVLAMEPPLGGQTVVYSNRQVSECLRLPNRGMTLGSAQPISLSLSIYLSIYLCIYIYLSQVGSAKACDNESLPCHHYQRNTIFFFVILHYSMASTKKVWQEQSRSSGLTKL